MIEQPLALAATIAAITTLAFWLDRRFSWAAKVGATLLTILFGAVLSNAGMVPAQSVIYDAITGPVTSLAIVWLLFAVDLRDLRAAGPVMLRAFGIAAAATAVGAVIATLAFADAFGDEAWKLAGVLTGTYIGGSLNFVAVGRALELPDGLFAAATAADNVVTALWFAVTLTLPVWLAHRFPSSASSAAAAAPRGHAPAPALVPAGGADSAALGSTAPRVAGASQRAAASVGVDAGGAGAAAADGTDGAAEDSSEESRFPGAAIPDRSATADRPAGSADDGALEHPFFGTFEFRVQDLAALLALGLGVLLASEAIAARVPGVPGVLWLTTIALGLGQVRAIGRLRGSLQLGSLALHFFFVVIGIGSRVGEILRVGPEVFYVTATVVLIHGIVLFGAASLARLDVRAAAVASQAAVGGPSTAMALAVARDWRALVLPGAATGLLGYAVGNYAGLAVAYLIRGLVGG